MLRSSAALQALPGVQTARGEPRRFNVTQEGCGGWMPAEYRMCADELKGLGEPVDIEIEGGGFYAQRFSEAPALTALGGRCKQGAFFHMQEWKKRWGEGQANIDPAAALDTFRVAADGIHAVRV